MASRSESDRPHLAALRARRPALLSAQAGLREVMARFATGITVLTVCGPHGHGMTANAFSSLSLDPPLVLCCVARAARMHTAITSAGTFAVSMLGADQRDLAKYFADWWRPGGLAQFDCVEWTEGACTGAPLLDGALAWLECKVTNTFDGGDHSIFVGEVLAASRGDSPHGGDSAYNRAKSTESNGGK